MHSTRRDSNARFRRHRVGAFAACTLLGVVALGGCGDDEKSAQERYCEAGNEVESSVTALTNLDLIAEGTNGLEAAINDVQEDVSTLVDTASEAAADESAALEQSIESLQSAIEGLAGEISSDNVSALTTAIDDVSTSAQAVYATLSDCP